MGKEILNNKNCFITGATGGLGRLIAARMAEAGCNLFITSRSSEGLSQLKDEIESAYGRNINVFYEYGDLSEIDDVRRIISTVRNTIGSIDILVNCAGIFPVITLSNSEIDDFDDCFNVNVRAPFLFCKEFSKDMIRNGWGRIINIGSSSAYGGYKETSIYCASKHALLGFSRALHDELKKHNIRVFCVSPGSVKTKMGKQVKNQNYETFIDAEDIAEYIAFIISFNGAAVSDEIRINRMVME